MSNTFIFIFFIPICSFAVVSAITSVFSILSSLFTSLFSSLFSSFVSLFSSSTFSGLFSFSSGNNRFNKIPTIAAKLIPEIVTDKSPDTIDIAAPPRPKTSIVDATTIFFAFPKSI